MFNPSLQYPGMFLTAWNQPGTFTTEVMPPTYSQQRTGPKNPFIPTMQPTQPVTQPPPTAPTSPTGIPWDGNFRSVAQTAPRGSSGQGGNAAPGAGLAGQGQGSYLLQAQSAQDFNKGSGMPQPQGQIPALPTVQNSAFSRPNYTVLTPQQMNAGYTLQGGQPVRQGLFSI